ncbi:hypothetical protein FOZ63_012436, partial [Perkinsus olseni]
DKTSVDHYISAGLPRISRRGAIEEGKQQQQHHHDECRNYIIGSAISLAMEDDDDDDWSSILTSSTGYAGCSTSIDSWAVMKLYNASMDKSREIDNQNHVCQYDLQYVAATDTEEVQVELYLEDGVHRLAHLHYSNDSTAAAEELPPSSPHLATVNMDEVDYLLERVNLVRPSSEEDNDRITCLRQGVNYARKVQERHPNLHALLNLPSIHADDHLANSASMRDAVEIVAKVLHYGITVLRRFKFPNRKPSLLTSFTPAIRVYLELRGGGSSRSRFHLTYCPPPPRTLK